MEGKAKTLKKMLRESYGDHISVRRLGEILRGIEPSFTDKELSVLMGADAQKSEEIVNIEAFVDFIYFISENQPSTHPPGNVSSEVQQMPPHFNASLLNGKSIEVQSKSIQLIIVRHGLSWHNLVEDISKDASGCKISELKSLADELKESEALRDSPLTSVGYNEAQQLGRALQGETQPDIVFVSPLRRTIQTLFGIRSGGGFQSSETKLCEAVAEMRRSKRPQNIRNSLPDLQLPGMHAEVVDMSKVGIPDLTNTSDSASVKSESRNLDSKSSAEFLNNMKRGKWASVKVDGIDAFIQESLVGHVDDTNTTQPLLPLHLVSEGSALKSVSGDNDCVTSLVDDRTLMGWEESGTELPAERPERFLKTLHDFIAGQSMGWHVVGLVSHNYFLKALLQHLYDDPTPKILGGANDVAHLTPYSIELECKDGTCVLTR